MSNLVCVGWEYRVHYDDRTSTPGWGSWEKVEPRNALCTVEDRVREIQLYIKNGYKYELRALYTCSTEQQKDLKNIVENL